MTAPTTGLRLSHQVDPALAESWIAHGYWGATGLRDGLERWAADQPDRRALVDHDRSWSYGQLEEQVAHMVGALTTLGVTAGSHLLLVTPITAPGVAAFLAAVRVGALAVMLDRRCGRTDLEHAIQPLDIRLVISTAELTERLGLDELGPRAVTFEELASAEPYRSWPEPDLQAPASIFFTSGTTDRPKSVVHSIDTMRAGARNMADALVFGADDAAFLSSPVASITGVMQIFLTLERGGALVLEDRFDANASLQRLIESDTTVLGGAPVIPEELFREARRQGLTQLPLRAISLGGAMIPRDLLELAMDLWNIVPVRIYGSSEAPVSTYTLPTDEGDRRLSDDGAMAPGTEIRIDDALGGEVLLRGPMMFLGYLHDEDNEAAFADGWLRTGDLGRVDEGRLTITGRIKEVVARKGLKISLPEIDGVARRLPGATEVAAYGVPDADTGERLALAIYADGDVEASYDSVTEWLLEAGLAKWKLPEEVVVWDEPLPRTSSGKIQRRKLDGGGTRRDLAPRLSPRSPDPVSDGR